MTNSMNLAYKVPRNPRFARVSKWISDLQNNDAKLSDHFMEVYGDDQSLIDQRKAFIIKALENFGDIYGTDREVVITRSPCRINLRGMHSDMQRATPNYLNHAREMVIIAGKRDDDRVVLNNVDSERFGRREFSISEEMEVEQWGSWIDYIDSHAVREHIELHRGDWANYVKASVLKFQDEFNDIKLKGMDIVAYGDAPCGNGMASSSTLVVSSGLAFLAVNGLSIDPRELVVCFGRGEWFVGTRGGFGDHGAMIFGKKGHILHSIFLTMDDIQPEYIPFPDDHQVIIINSYRTSTKSEDRLFAYNQTMFAYSMAMTLIKDVLKDSGSYSDELLSYLGQITPEAFGIEKIYTILRSLPERITISDLKARYTESEIDHRLDRFFGQLNRYPDHVDVRGPALWGIAECERSRAFARLIKEGKIRDAGELMFIGHNGDRLFTFDGDYKTIDYVSNKVTNTYLDGLLADQKSNDSQRLKRSELAKQPGDYDASSLELDRIVEIAGKVDGVVGASLTGAGFGGNVLAIVEKSDDSLSKLKKSLLRDYYEHNELDELKWLKQDKDLLSAFGNKDELMSIRDRASKIVQRKQESKSPMQKDDIRFVENLQRKINILFKEGKISREMMFIPANYYEEGVTVNLPVGYAEAL